MLLLAACAPSVQRALKVGEPNPAPRFAAAEQRFFSFDGAALGLSTWTPARGDPWAVIVGVHGMNDYGETFYLAAPYWAEQGIATYAYDARGFGRSPRRGVWPGEDLIVADLKAAVTAARAAHPDAIIAVAGHSMGGASAVAAFASDDPPDADRLILVAPAVWGWSHLPAPYSITLWIAAHTFPYTALEPTRSISRAHQPSDNIEMLRKIGRDPNMLFATRTDAIFGLVNLMETASKKIDRLDPRTRTLLLYGANDFVIPERSVFETAKRLPAHVRTAYYPDGWHMLLRDLQAETVWRDIAVFLADPSGALPSGASGLPAGKTLTAAK
jgi:acylglycerol lipase